VILWITAIVLLCVLLLLGRLFAGREMDEARSVLLHLPFERAWDAVRDFPALHAAHTRGRPRLLIKETLLREGSGQGPRSVWRQSGRWGEVDYWADLEVTEWDPPHRMTVRLVRDSLATHRGLMRHRGELTLVPEGPAVTKLTWRLSVRIGTLRLLLVRMLWPERMRARLLDLGLRSVKRAIDGVARDEGRVAEGPTAIEALLSPAADGRAPDRQRRPPAGRSTGRVQDQA